MEHNNMAVQSVPHAATEQRRTKVTFCLEPSQGDPRPKHKTTAVSSKPVVTLTGCSAVSMSTVTCSETVMSAAAGLPPPSTVNVNSVPHVHVPADSSDVSLLCSELFVDNNPSFCDQLLESFTGLYDLPDVPHRMPGSSSTSKQDIPEPVADFVFDDFVEFDHLFSYD